MVEEQIICNQDTMFELSEYILMLVPIVISAIIAFLVTSITIKASRVSNSHSEMCACLIDTIFINKEILSLLKAITKGEFYRQKVPRVEFNKEDNAHSRYWNEIGNLSKQSKIIRVKQLLFLPSNLFEKSEKVRKKLNEGNRLAETAYPEGKIFPDTTELQKVVKEAEAAYEDLINNARAYIGTEKLKPIITEESL